MCILFIYTGTHDDQSDYKMILISNRDEYYDRPAKNMEMWSEHPIVIAGRDLQAKDDSTWLAISPTYKKIGVLLNLPGNTKEDPISRGKIVAEYVKSNEPVQNYIESIKTYTKDCNGFIFVSVEFGNVGVSTFSYSNVINNLRPHTNAYHGFSNSLPDTPLKKTKYGEIKMEEICSKFNKESMVTELMQHLIELLKSEESHLPDKILEAQQPNWYNELSSIYVCMPNRRYGTRTHTIILLTKKGHLSITELTQQISVNCLNPVWQKTEFNYYDIL